MMIKYEMMQTDKLPLISFFHAQRTGGSEFKRFLRAGFGDEYVYSPQTVTDYIHWDKLKMTELESYKVYAGHSNFSGQAIEGRTILPVTTIRDPIIRAFSLYQYCRNKDGHALQDMARENSLFDFYIKGSQLKPTYFLNVQCRRICGRPNHNIAFDVVCSKYFAVSAMDNLHELSSKFIEMFNLKVEPIEKRDPDIQKNAPNIPDDFRELVTKMNGDDVVLFSKLEEIVA